MANAIIIDLRQQRQEHNSNADEGKSPLSLTERERIVLKLRQQGLSDYKIARKIGADPPSIVASRKNALRKLKKANEDLAWAKEIGVATS